MTMSPPSPRRRWSAEVLPRRRSRIERMRVTMHDGARTTVHVASYELAAFVPRVVVLERPVPLVRWCREHGIRNAVVGGFYQRPEYSPLGQLWTEGERRDHVPFASPWGEARATVELHAGAVRIARRN